MKRLDRSCLDRRVSSGTRRRVTDWHAPNPRVVFGKEDRISALITRIARRIHFIKGDKSSERCLLRRSMKLQTLRADAVVLEYYQATYVPKMPVICFKGMWMGQGGGQGRAPDPVRDDQRECCPESISPRVYRYDRENNESNIQRLRSQGAG